MLMSFTISGAQTTEVIVENQIYKIWYNQKYQQPTRVIYNVMCPTGTVSRSGMDFYTVKNLVTSDDADYADNVWDKGHMAPAADFNCSEAMLRLTFSYANCALQHQSLNRGPWKELEKFERDLTKIYKNVTIQIDVIFEDKTEYWLKTGALVPIAFIKTIMYEDQVIRFYFPNKSTTNRDWIEYKIN